MATQQRSGIEYKTVPTSEVCLREPGAVRESEHWRSSAGGSRPDSGQRTHSRPPPCNARGESFFRSLIVCIVFAPLLCLSCSTPPPTNKSFPLEGEVTLLVPDLNRVVVRHGRIEGWSSGTNMEYPVKDPAVIGRLSVGNQIRAVVQVAGSQYWLSKIEVIPVPDQVR